MKIKTDNSRYKLYLGLVGLLIVILSVLYTNFLAGKVAEQEQKYTRFYAMAQEDIQEGAEDEEYDLYCDPTLQLEILASNTTIPVITTNEQGGINWAANYGDKDEDHEYLLSELAKMQDAGIQPLQSYAGTNIWFRESNLLWQLRFFPLLQLLLIGAFILFGYFAINAARRAEQNRVWVGMAKETAHQLGTPISAIIAWLEHLKMIREEDEEVQDVVMELTNDVDRLNLVADRFSKIGSTPKLEVVSAHEELDKCREYMEKRAPRRVKFNFPEETIDSPSIAINPPLFDWVIENLLRNSLDAMEGRGEISAEIYEDANAVYFDLTDTGKGIPTGKFKTVFKPGYTTKKRGWGLGLSLAKRIIEEYHKGKIFVKKSVEGEGTTFTISLPKVSISGLPHQASQTPATVN